MNRKDSLLLSVISLSREWMGGRGHALSPRVKLRGIGVPDGEYYLQVTRISDVNLMIQEFVLNRDGENQLFRIWTLKKERQWEVVSLEKNKKHVYLRDYVVELEDLFRRMTLLQRIMSVPGFYYSDERHRVEEELELPPVPLKRRGPAALLKWIQDFSLRPAVFVPIISGSLLVLAAVAGAYVINLNKIKGEIDGSIDEYISQVQTQLKTLDSFRAEAQVDLEVLKGNLAQEQTDFDFNRHNAYVNVLRLSEELTKYLPARKEAYRLIADNIKDSISYGEIIYEMSRLPSAEYQARIFLATDRQKVVPLGRFNPVFKGMVYPVEVETEENNGLGFRITDGYMESREDPLGSGGMAPHFAVDIINVANISLINYAGEIVRDGNPSGKVVAVQEGMILETGVDDRYGWHIEVEHPLTAEVKRAYPSATAWSTYYAHLLEEPAFSSGQWVTQRQVLGDIGNTGSSTGPHLHFEVRVYRSKGAYFSEDGRRFDKINPYPLEG